MDRTGKVEMWTRKKLLVVCEKAWLCSDRLQTLKAQHFVSALDSQQERP